MRADFQIRLRSNGSAGVIDVFFVDDFRVVCARAG